MTPRPIDGERLRLLAHIDGETLVLPVPLTCSLNRLAGQHWATRRRMMRGAAVELLVLAQARSVLGPGYQRPWARRAELAVIRCSTGVVAADDDNVIAGCKKARDALRYAGLIPDDAPRYLTVASIEDRPRGHWGELEGPSTWLRLRRVE